MASNTVIILEAGVHDRVERHRPDECTAPRLRLKPSQRLTRPTRMRALAGQSERSRDYRSTETPRPALWPNGEATELPGCVSNNQQKRII